MFLKAVFPGKYIQGEGVIAELPALAKLLGKKGLILTSATGRDKLLPPYAGQWRQEQRGPLRAAVWFDDKRDARIGISDMDGSEDLMSRYRPIAKPVSGVPVL